MDGYFKDKQDFGIKFFKEVAHKQMFDAEKLFTNPISYYRKNEKELGQGRGDSNEGILSVQYMKNNNVVLHDKNGNLISKGEIVGSSISLFEDQHIFSFIYLEKNWYEIEGKKIHLKIPKVILDYFYENYGNYFSTFPINNLISRLNNKVLDDGVLAYFTHFKIDYIDEKYLTSESRWEKLNKAMDDIKMLEDDFEHGKPKLDQLLKDYMGVKSNKYHLENEMRIVLGLYSNESSLIDF